MDDAISKITALEKRLEALEARLDETHSCTGLAFDLAKRGISYTKEIDRRYGAVKQFCDVASPIILECDRTLHPVNSMKRAQLLTFAFKQRNEDNVH